MTKLDPWATGMMRGAEYNDGWLEVPDTWTYISATQAQCDGDRVSMYPVGTKVQWTQTTVKYGYVIAASLGVDGKTTLTITGGSDYSIANAAITNPRISYGSCPRGFPGWFNWAPTLGGWAGGAEPTATIYRFRIDGRSCTAMVRQGTAGTSNSTSVTLSAPVSCAVITNGTWLAAGVGEDNSAVLANPIRAQVVSASPTTITCYATFAAGGWTASNGKRVNFTLVYEI